MTRDRGSELRGDADATAFFERMSHHMPRVFIAVMSRLPAEPRCRLCRAPYGGIGGRIMRRFGFGPSRKNPNLCSTCFEMAPMGGVEMEIGVEPTERAVDLLAGAPEGSCLFRDVQDRVGRIQVLPAMTGELHAAFDTNPAAGRRPA